MQFQAGDVRATRTNQRREGALADPATARVPKPP